METKSSVLTNRFSWWKQRQGEFKVLWLEAFGMYAIVKAAGLLLENRQVIPLSLLLDVKKQGLEGKLAVVYVAAKVVFS